MAKKLSLSDLKVQSFVTTLNAQEADQLVGGTEAETHCGASICLCTRTHVCGCTNASNCCDTYDQCSQTNCTGTLDTGAVCCADTLDFCGPTTLNCTGNDYTSCC
jgi:hypothetical protein